MSASANALLPVRLLTVSVDVSAATSGTSPSNEAFVPPPTIAVGKSSAMPMAAPNPLEVTAVALLSEIASTRTAPPGTCIDDAEPTRASVSAALVTSASADAPAPAKRPNEITVAVAVASLSEVELSVTPVALTMSPLNSALVPPATVAVGRATPTDTIPPVPASESAVAWLSESASTETVPDVVMFAEEATRASTSAFEVTVASAPAPPPPNTAPKPTTKVSASAKFSPSASTIKPEADERTPSKAAVTPPPTEASASMTATEPSTPRLPPRDSARALLLAP